MDRARETAEIIQAQLGGSLPMESDIMLEEGGPVPPQPTITYWGLPEKVTSTRGSLLIAILFPWFLIHDFLSMISYPWNLIHDFLSMISSTRATMWMGQGLKQLSASTSIVLALSKLLRAMKSWWPMPIFSDSLCSSGFLIFWTSSWTIHWSSVFDCRALQFPSHGWMRFFIAHASISLLHINPDGTVSMTKLGDAGHMPPDVVTIWIIYKCCHIKCNCQNVFM